MRPLQLEPPTVLDARPRVAPPIKARHALALTVGIVLGAGVFRTPSLAAANVEGVTMLLAAWIAGALIALVGALCYAELATTYREGGGDYAYLRRAFGPRLAFLYGWARLTVIQSGSIAVLAFVFSDYASQIAPLGAHSSALYAAAAILVITAVNLAGVREGARAQTALTLLEVAGLGLVVIAGLLVAPEAAPAPAPGAASGSALGLVMVFVLLTYGGWNEAVYLSSEVRGGPRRMAAVLTGGIAIIAVLYLLANLAYLRALGLGGMAASDAVAADVMRAAFGSTGASLIALIVAIAALTSANATAITGARSAWALGRDVPRLAVLNRWDDVRGGPRNAFLVQAAIALALVGMGAVARSGFETTVEYTAPVFWFFFLLVGIALFVLRRRDPDRARPFRVPLYPLLPALFCATNAYLLWSSLAYTGWGALVGVAVLALGFALLPFLTPKEPAR